MTKQLFLLSSVKTSVRSFQIFVAFSEKLNFKSWNYGWKYIFIDLREVSLISLKVYTSGTKRSNEIICESKTCLNENCLLAYPHYLFWTVVCMHCTNLPLIFRKPYWRVNKHARMLIPSYFFFNDTFFWVLDKEYYF